MPRAGAWSALIEAAPRSRIFHDARTFFALSRPESLASPEKPIALFEEESESVAAAPLSLPVAPLCPRDSRKQAYARKSRPPTGFGQALARIPLVLGDLPCEVLLHVFSFLDARALCVAARVCSRWRTLASDEALWREQLTRTFPGTASPWNASLSRKQLFLLKRRELPVRRYSRAQLKRSGEEDASAPRKQPTKTMMADTRKRARCFEPSTELVRMREYYFSLDEVPLVPEE